MEKLKISLIICAHNEENYIGDCLKSVMKYAGQKLHEVIVVDNCSTDKTAEIARSFGAKVVPEKRKGLTRARQRGFIESTGNILAFIDADTRIRKGWIDEIEKEFVNKDLAVLSGPYVYYDIQEWQKSLVKLYWQVVAPVSNMVGYTAVGGNFAIRRTTLEKMNGFDTSIEFYGEDTDIARRASQFGQVKFKLEFFIYSSGRRLNHHGLFKTGYLYVSNFFSEVFMHKPAHTDYMDIR